MISSEIKTRVAQNCAKYNHKNYLSGMSMLEARDGCHYCKNYIKGRCEENLLHDTYKIIRFN